MGHVSANNSSANDKFFLAGHGDLPSVQPNSYDHRVSSFMSCTPHQNRSHLFSNHVTERTICAWRGSRRTAGSAWCWDIMFRTYQCMPRTYRCPCDRRASGRSARGLL